MNYSIEKFDYQAMYIILKSKHIDRHQSQRIMNCMSEHDIRRFESAEEAMEVLGTTEKAEDDDFSQYKSSRYLGYGAVKQKKFEEIYAGEVAEEIEEFRLFLNSDDDLIFEYDPSFKQTVLFHGPTGTGKTTLAYAIAAESGLPFFKLEANEIEDKYIGESERHLAQVFKDIYDYACKKESKVVLFIDEIDNLLSSRGREGGSTEAYHYKLVSVFLNYFGDNDHDELRKDFLKKIVLIGATNYPEKIPANVKSRFFIVSEIPKPDDRLRTSILAFQIGQINQKYVAIDEGELEDIARTECAGLNARQISDAVKKAARKAYFEKKREQGDGMVRRKHFEFLKGSSPHKRSNSFDKISYMYN